MEKFRERLRSMKEQQNELIKEYQKLISEYESHDLVNENAQLKKQYEEHKQALAEMKIRAGGLQEENTELRIALAEQIMDEKLNVIKISRQKLQTYFASRSKGHLDRLTAFEQETKHRLDRLYDDAARRLGEDKAEIGVRIAVIAAEVNEKMQLERLRQSEAERNLLFGMDNKLDELAAEKVSDEVMRRRRKQNQIEMKIGLNWLNRLAILLLILAVGAGFRYSYSTWFNGYMKGGAFFLMGVLMLGGGEWLFRKNKGAFALGLLGGGISVLYGSIFYSYFLLDIISIYVGLSLSVLVTLTAVLLSLRYESRTICSLGLAGGYLPLFSYIGAFGLTGSAVYAAMGYLFLLNLLLLLISFRKRWVIVNYISFLLNTPSMLLLIGFSASSGVSMLYAALTFAMYLGITLWYPFRYRTKLSWWDFSLLGCNTFISCLTLYALLLEAGHKDYRGGLALLFCLMYLGLGRLLEKLMPQEKQSMLLFYATSITFAILLVPFQLGAAWWTIGWLAEAVALTFYGHFNRFKGMERSGWGILLLCLVSFFGAAVPLRISESNGLLSYHDPYFTLKYTFITAGMLAVALLYAVRHNRKEYLAYNGGAEVKGAVWFKYAALLNFWAYLLYALGRLYTVVVPENFAHARFYHLLLAALVTMGMAFVLPKVAVLYDNVVKYYTILLYVVGYTISLCVTVGLPSLRSSFTPNTGEDYLALVVLTAFNILVYFSGRDLLIAFLRREYKSIELCPVILAVYLLGIITAFLGVQLQLNDAGLVFSLVYLLLAVLYIAYGFRQRYVYIRRFGLGLTLLATGKLLLYDLSLLTTGSKIIAYFSFGIILLGISYLYQRVSDRLGDPRPGAKPEQSGAGTGGPAE